MSFNDKMNAEFLHYLESMVSLDALDRVTKDLDEELQDSQKVMNDIKGMIDSLPQRSMEVAGMAENLGNSRVPTSFLLESHPKLLLQDMPENIVDSELKGVLSTLKSYTEEIKKSFENTEACELSIDQVKQELEDLNLEQYAVSLDELSKRLSTLKLNKTEEPHDRNPELEDKLVILIKDIDMFTQMIQAKTKLSEVNQSMTPSSQNMEALKYDALLTKLLNGMNEIAYLLHNKN